MPYSELERLRILSRLSKTFHASLSFSEILPRVLQETVDALDAEAGSLWLLDETGQQLVCQTATGPASDQIEGVAVPLGAGIVGSVVATRRSEVVADASRDRRFLFQVDQQTGFITRTMLCAPLIRGAMGLGAIQILNARITGDQFPQEDIDFLEAIAADAAQAVENAHLFASARRAQDLDAILRLARELTATVNLEDLLDRTAKAVTALTGCDRAAVALYPEHSSRPAADAVTVQGEPAAGGPSPGDGNADPSSVGTLRIAASSGEADRGLPARVQAVSGLLEERYVSSVNAENHASPPSPHCRSFLALPLRDSESAIGVLYAESGREDAFSTRQRELATILSQQATVAVRNALLYSQLSLAGTGWSLRRSLRSAASFHSTRPGRTRLILGIAMVLGAIGLIPWDYRVVAPFQFRYTTRVEVTARTDGRVRQVLVHEGQAVHRDDVLAELEDREVEQQINEVTTRRDLALQALHSAQASGDSAAYLEQSAALRREESTLALLSRRREAALIRSPLDGVVLTPRIEERNGEVLRPGSVFCAVGTLDMLDAELKVPEDRVPEIAPGQTVLLQVSARPGDRFQAHVTRIGMVGEEHPGGATFPVVCTIRNPGRLFRPGEEGWARITVGRRPVGYTFLKRAWDWVRMAWWRLW